MGQEADMETAQVAVAVVMAPPGSAVVKPPGSGAVTVSSGDAHSSMPMWQQEKQGAKCCGCCCDYRRAVIILAVISICVNLATVILFLAAISTPTTSVNVDDDVALAIYDDSLTTQIVVSGISLACSICALVGAKIYNIPLVAINTLWYVAGFVINTVVIINTNSDVQDQTGTSLPVVPNIVASAIGAIIFMYPHIGFMYEVKVGIMSYATYPREEFSCCCAPGARR